MTTYYFDSENTADPSRDGLSEAHPLLDPSELGTPWRMASGNTYLFKRGRTWNFAAAFRTTAFTGAKITVSAYGDGTKPIIRMVRALASGECVEVAFGTPGTTNGTITPTPGTNLWNVPKQFFGLFANGVWGAETDGTGTRAIYGVVMPSIPGEWSTVGADSTRVIYSVGNPVDVLGGVLVNQVSDGNWSTEYERYAVSLIQPFGGVEVSNIEFQDCEAGVVYETGNPTFPTRKMPNAWVLDCRFKRCYFGIRYLGGSAYNVTTLKKGWKSPRVLRNYAENLGGAFISTGTGLFNDARILENVVNVANKTTSTGAFYFGGNSVDDGNPIIVARNSIYGVAWGNVWQLDGYALYQEENTESIIFEQNFVWGCKGATQANQPRRGVVFRHNVVMATSPSDVAYHINANGVESASVLYVNNVAVGYNAMIEGTYADLTQVQVLSNVSMAGGSGGDMTRAAIRLHGTAPGALPSVIADGNNLYGHPYMLVNTNPGSDQSGAVTNAITADPSAEIARLPVPTDPTVNYALQLSPNFWSGTVDLRPGTRVAT